MEEQGIEKILPSSEFFINAGRFMYMVEHIHENEGTGVEQIRSFLAEVNNCSVLRSKAIKIESDKLLVDWSCGEADIDIAVEEIKGQLAGTFIGYQVFPDENPYTGEILPTLAVAISASMEDPDVDSVTVIALAAIPNSNIELLP